MKIDSMSYAAIADNCTSIPKSRNDRTETKKKTFKDNKTSSRARRHSDLNSVKVEGSAIKNTVNQQLD